MLKLRQILCVLAVFSCTACVQKIPVEPVPGPEPEPQEEQWWSASANVYGTVSCDGSPVAGAVVSDGFEVTATDALGHYELTSVKRFGYVFVSIPSGYEAPLSGVLPQFYKYVNGRDKVEEINFSLNEADQQDYSLLVFGDMHLAGRMNDVGQFAEFADDVNAYLDANEGRKVYAVTLGDMTWDIFWYRYPMSDYLEEVEYDFGGRLPMFHTIGNHDHQSDLEGDFFTAGMFRKTLGPTYYSFNIGGIHYIVLDDILCQNDGTNRTFSRAVADEEINWLKKDLQYVSHDTPIFITVHAPVYYESGSLGIKNGFNGFISLFAGYDRVQIFSGHTHIIYNVDRLSSSVHVHESNSGAVCGGWWMTGNNTGVHLSGDGAPGGYRVVNVSGKDYDWYFKGTGLPETCQFRAYDRNCLHLSTDNYTPNATATGKQAFTETVGEYAAANHDNYVLLNIWDWDDGWSVKVTENGRELPVTRLHDVKDPLYLVCYEGYEYENHYDNTIYYPAYTTTHMFRVQASSPTSTLEITVRDKFGRVYSEEMTRPREFGEYY